MPIDTSKLKDYAKLYAEAINRGASDAEAHKIAQSQYGVGGGLTLSDLQKVVAGSRSSGSSGGGSSSGGSSSSLRSLLDAEAKKYGITPVSDTPGSPYYRETSSGGGGTPPSSSDLAVTGRYGSGAPGWIPGYTWVPSGGGTSGGGTSGISSDVIAQVLADRLNQLNQWRPPSLPSPAAWQSPSIPTPTPPPKVETPKVETAPRVENVPAAAAPQQTTTLPSGVTQGAGGFSYQASLPPVLPTADKLLETYRQVFGKSGQDVQQYLQSPDFQQVLSGNVPMWMEADPLWRRYLRLLGISRRLQGNQ